MALYGIYDMKNSEQCMGIFTICEAMNFLGLSESHIYRCIRQSILAKDRYAVKRIKGRNENEV